MSNEQLPDSSTLNPLEQLLVSMTRLQAQLQTLQEQLQDIQVEQRRIGQEQQRIKESQQSIHSRLDTQGKEQVEMALRVSHILETGDAQFAWMTGLAPALDDVIKVDGLMPLADQIELVQQTIDQNGVALAESLASVKTVEQRTAVVEQKAVRHDVYFQRTTWALAVGAVALVAMAIALGLHAYQMRVTSYGLRVPVSELLLFIVALVGG